MKSALSSGNKHLFHSSGEEKQLSLELGDHGGILTAAIEKMGRHLGNNLRQIILVLLLYLRLQVWCMAGTRKGGGRLGGKARFGQSPCREDWDLPGWDQACESEEFEFRGQVKGWSQQEVK